MPMQLNIISNLQRVNRIRCKEKRFLAGFRVRNESCHPAKITYRLRNEVTILCNTLMYNLAYAKRWRVTSLSQVHTGDYSHRKRPL